MTQGKETNLTIEQRLSLLQKKLKAPKEKNDKVAYKSRSAEQILEAAKECLAEGEFIICEDDIVHIGDRYYVKSISKFCFGEKFISTTAFAREQEEILNSYNKPMMQQPQVTGASSSYARKYSLQGLFALDDSSDDPDKNNHAKDEKQSEKPKAQEPAKPKTTEEKKAEAIKTYGQETIETYELISAALNSSKDEKQLDTILKVRANDIEKMNETVRGWINKVADTRRIALCTINAG